MSRLICYSASRNISTSRRSSLDKNLHSTTAKSTAKPAATADAAPPDWKAKSAAAALQAFPKLRDVNSTKVSLLLVLLSFFDDVPITAELLWRGGTYQKRWNQLGEVTELELANLGLHQDLSSMLSDRPGLNQLFLELETANVIQIAPSTGLKILNRQTAAQVVADLPDTTKIFWRHQVLLITSYAFPRRYLGPK